MICADVLGAAVVVVVALVVVVGLVEVVALLVVVVAELACEEVLVGVSVSVADDAVCEEASDSVEIGPQAHNEITKNKQRITVHIFFILKTPFITTNCKMLGHIILNLLSIVKKLSMII